MKQQYETQLKYRALDENGDMLFGRGEGGFLSGRAAMRQVLMTRLRAIRDEWWEGDRTALPYFTQMLAARGSDASRAQIDLLIIERIMDTIGVTGVENISSSIENRRYIFNCTVHTVYGDTAAEVSL